MSRFSNDPQHITGRTIEAVLKGIEQSPEASQELVDEARAALQDMPDATQLTPRQLVEITKNGTDLEGDLVALLMAKIPQGAKPKARGLIETALSAGVRACTTTDNFRKALSFDLLQDLSRDMAQVNDNTTVTRDTSAKIFAGLEGMLRPEMNTLACSFGHHDPEGVGLTELKVFLQQKAEDFRRYEALIEALDDRRAGLGKYKAAAKDALERLEFDAVEKLLARVDQEESESAAQTKELRADNALLQGKLAAAFAHLNAAADSFQGIDLVEPARRRVEYADRLYQHGLRYGGAGLELAVQMLSTVIEQSNEADNPDIWASAQNTRCIIFHDMACVAHDEQSLLLLTKAEHACSEAKRVSEATGIVELLSSALNNLGLVLEEMGKRVSGKSGMEFLLKSVSCHHQALSYREEFTEEWAATQNNLGCALMSLVACTDINQPNEYLKGSIKAFKRAEAVSTKEKNLEKWATTRNNRAIATRMLGYSMGGAEGLELSKRAILLFKSCLEVHSRENHPSY